MTNLQIEVPEDLARGLEAVARLENKTVQQVALERLRSVVEQKLDSSAGTAAAVLRAMRESPHVSATDVDELEQAIATGRKTVHSSDPFQD